MKIARTRLLVGLDVLVAVLLGFVQIQIAGNLLKDRPDFAFAFVAACLTATVLAATVAVRRRWPFQALLAALAVWIIAYVTGALWGAYVAVALALYTVAVTEAPRRSLRAFAICLAGAPVAVAADPYHGWVAAAWGTAAAWLLLGGTWLAGRTVRDRRLTALQAERDRAHQILVDERLRIACELHDVVTHGMGLIAVKASIANHIADDRPEEAREALRVIEATRRIREAPGTEGVRVLMLTMFDLDAYVFSALRAGASGFLLKDTPPGDLLDAIRVVAAGEALLAPTVTRRLIEEFAARPEPARPLPRTLQGVTEREREVLTLIARGLSNTEIAGHLHLSLATVKTYVGRLLAKLGARDRAQLVIIAYESGLASTR